jgi:hypothetical protein
MAPAFQAGAFSELHYQHFSSTLASHGFSFGEVCNAKDPYSRTGIEYDHTFCGTS